MVIQNEYYLNFKQYIIKSIAFIVWNNNKNGSLSYYQINLLMLLKIIMMFINIKMLKNYLTCAILTSLLFLNINACNLQSNQNDHQYLKQLTAISTNSSCQQDCCDTVKNLPRQRMTWYYFQNTGKFYGGSGDFKIDTYGYSGQGEGYLNPDYQCKIDGPLPASTYQVAFCKNMMHQLTQRPCSFYLKPLKPQQVCGRDDFFIHGCQSCTGGDDTNPPAPGCSAGCVIISYQNRKKIRIGDLLIVQNYEPKNYENLKNHQEIEVLLTE